MKAQPSRGGRATAGFTLIELLTVIAIVAILAAVLFPSLRGARAVAAKVRTKVQFNQWAAALEMFRAEYGRYPALHPSGLANPPGQATDPSAPHLLHDVLAAARRNGVRLAPAAAPSDPLLPEVQNRKLIRFHAFSASELGADGLLQDASGNTEIAVLVDANLDGVIDAADHGGTIPAVRGLRPSAADVPAAGIRAGVVLYAPAPGADAANPEFVFSWK